MKLKSILALAIAMVLTTASSFAATYTDSSANYPGGEGISWENGANGGEGFGAWVIETTFGAAGWSGYGIWNPSANNFQGTWADKTAAFGLMGKGDGYSVTASRPFRAALAVGDSFSLEMAVNWDSDCEGALKGFVLTAGGEDIVTVNHEFDLDWTKSGWISINGENTSSDVLNTYGVNPMVWTFTAKDATTITVTATPRDGSEQKYEQDWEVSTSAIDGFRLQSAEQANQDEDRRQSYFDNFKLELVQELPELRTFTITPPENAWIVNEKQKIMYFTITRSNSDGELEASIEYSDSQFVSGQFWASFADGQADCTNVQVIAGVSGNANVGTMTVSAEGYEPASYDFKGPVFTFTTAEDSTTLNKGATLQCWANAKADSGFIADTNKILLLVEQEGDVVSVPETLEWNADEEQGGFYTPFEVEGLAGGTADVSLVYDGAKVITKQFTVIGKSLTWVPPTDEAWKINEATVLQEFSLTRNDAEGELTVSIESSDTSFLNASSASVTFADGEDTVSGIQVTGTILGSANFATLTASAEGYVAAEYNFSGPAFSFTTQDDATSFMVGDTLTCWANARTATGVIADTTKISLVADPEGVVELPASLEWGDADDGGFYTEFALSGNAAGTTVVSVVYDGVSVLSKEFTVVGYDINAISGPASVYTGSDNTYTIEYLFGEETAATVTLSDNSLGALDETSITLYPDATEYPIVFSAGDTEGTVTITVEDLNGHSASIEVTITKEPDYSSYIAYDDASLYGGDFDYAALGKGTDQFQAWEEITKNSGNVFISGNAPDASVLTDDKAFGIWANGADDAELQLRRPFVNSLGDGQAFSVVVSPNYRDGTKGVKFLGYDAEVTHEWWQRAEFFYNNDGYFYKLEGDEDANSLGWDYGIGAITITLKKAADGSGYTLSFARGEEIVVKEGITSFGGTIDAVQFYSYQGGQGDENNFIFNKLAIEQIEEPIVTRAIGWGEGVYNPTGDGTYTITLTATTDDIGEVAISVDPADGALSLASDTVTFDGNTTATITYTLTGANAGDAFRISATPIDTDVAALVGEGAYGVTVIAPSIGWGEGVYNPEGDGTYTITLNANTTTIGIVNVSVDPAEGALSLASDTVDFAGGTTATITYILTGANEGDFFRINAVPENTAIAPLEGEAGYGVTVVASSEPIVLPSVSVVTSSKGRGLAFSAEALGQASLVGAYTLLGEVDWTKLVENEDYVVEGGQVVVLFDGQFFKDQKVGFVAAQ